MWLCTLLVAVSSCIAELTDSAGISSGLPTQEKVIIDLQLPQSGKPLTRAVAAGPQTTTRSQEGVVNDVYVLAFGTDATEPFLYYVKAVQQQGTQWEATLQLLEGREQSFVVIANVENQKGDLKTQLETLLNQPGSKDQPKSKLLRKLYVGDDSPLVAAEAAPLCGQTTATRVYSGYGQKLDVKLHRMTASLSFYVGDKAGSGIDGFILESISLYNVQGKGIVVPSELVAGFEGPVTKTTLPQAEGEVYDDWATIPLEGPFTFQTNGNIVENQIYFFENAQPRSGVFPPSWGVSDFNPAANDGKRPCIVIGGSWNGKKGYWRIDFKTDPHNKDTYVDLLRNHNYSFTLVSVRSDGANSEKEALAKSENDLQVEVIAMDDYSISNVAFDGQNFLGIQHKNYTVNRHGVDVTTGTTEFTQEVIARKGLAWTGRLLEIGAEGKETTPDWISFAKDSEKQETNGTGNGTSTETLNFYVDEWLNPSPNQTRTALMRFTAGNLLVEATVTQNDDYTVNLELTSVQELIINTDGTVTTPVDVKFGPAGATLEWAVIKGGGIEPTGGGTGQVIADATEENVQIGTGTAAITAADLNAQADLLYADYVTSMMVVARMGNAVKSLTIPVKQTKLGLELLDADGEYQPMTNYMTFNTNSNFKWTVSIVGEAPAHFVRGIDPTNNSGEGKYPSSTNVDFNLLTNNLSDDIDGENSGQVTLRFRDENSDFYVDKVIKFRSGLTINGQPMKIVGPVWRTPNDLTNLVDFNGTPNGNYGKWPDARVAQFISTKLGNNECVMYQKPGEPEGAYVPGSIYNNTHQQVDKNRRWVAIHAPNGATDVGFYVDTYRNGQKYVDPIWTITVSSTYSWRKTSFWWWQTVDATTASLSVTFPKGTTGDYLGEQFLTYGLFIDDNKFHARSEFWGGRDPDKVSKWNLNDYQTYVMEKLILYRYERVTPPVATTQHIAASWSGNADWRFDVDIRYNHSNVTPYQAAETRTYKTFYLLPREEGETSGVENIK